VASCVSLNPNFIICGDGAWREGNLEAEGLVWVCPWVLGVS
jgi:hypothetical protein